MKRTDYMILCGTSGKYGTAVYRTAMKDEDGKYYVKWNGKLVDVTKDIENRNYTPKWMLKEGF